MPTTEPNPGTVLWSPPQATERPLRAPVGVATSTTTRPPQSWRWSATTAAFPPARSTSAVDSARARLADQLSMATTAETLDRAEAGEVLAEPGDGPRGPGERDEGGARAHLGNSRDWRPVGPGDRGLRARSGRSRACDVAVYTLVADVLGADRCSRVHGRPGRRCHHDHRGWHHRPRACVRREAVRVTVGVSDVLVCDSQPTSERDHATGRSRRGSRSFCAALDPHDPARRQ